MEGTDQKEPFMGLLNNNDYIDTFKGSDYIDPSSNAERLSNQGTVTMHGVNPMSSGDM